MTGKRPLSQRIRAAWREGGAAAVLQGVVARAVEMRRMLLLTAPAEVLDAGVTSVAFEWATADVFDREIATPQFQFSPGAARRARTWLARGDRCLLGRVAGRPATYLWVSTTVRELPGMSCPIGPGLAYVYKTFTLPEFRGRGLNTAALREARRRCAMEGCREVLIDVASSNTASRRAIERAGFAQVGRFLVLRIGGTRRAWTSASVRRRIAGATVAA